MTTKNAYKLLSSIALGIAGASILALPTRGPAAWLTKIAAGSGLLVCGAGIGLSQEWQSEDFGGAAIALSEGWLHSTGPGAKTVSTAIAQRMPPQIRTAAEQFIQNSTVDFGDFLWKFAQKSSMVGGASNSGKSRFMLAMMAEIIRRKPDARIQICDTNYGKRGNRWSDAPLKRIVALEHAEIVAVFTAAEKELDRRRHAMADGTSVDLYPYYIFFDEFNETLKQCAFHGKVSPAEAKTLVSVIERLLFEAHGYNMFLIAGAQSLAVGTTGLSLAELNQMHVALVGQGAVNPNELQKICNKSTPYTEIIARVQAARKVPGGKHTGAFLIDGKPVTTHVVPEISLESVAIQWPSEDADPVTDWMSSLDWAEAMAQTSPSAAWDVVEGKGQKRAENRFWTEFRDEWKRRADAEIDAMATPQEAIAV